MKLSPFAFSAQRRHARNLARLATLHRQEALEHRQAAVARLKSNITTPHALALAAVGGLLVGMLAPQGRRAKPGEPAGSRRRPITNNLAVRQLMRAARVFVVGRLVNALGS